MFLLAVVFCPSCCSLCSCVPASPAPAPCGFTQWVCLCSSSHGWGGRPAPQDSTHYPYLPWLAVRWSLVVIPDIICLFCLAFCLLLPFFLFFLVEFTLLFLLSVLLCILLLVCSQAFSVNKTLVWPHLFLLWVLIFCGLWQNQSKVCVCDKTKPVEYFNISLDRKSVV